MYRKPINVTVATAIITPGCVLLAFYCSPNDIENLCAHIFGNIKFCVHVNISFWFGLHFDLPHSQHTRTHSEATYSKANKLIPSMDVCVSFFFFLFGGVFYLFFQCWKIQNTSKSYMTMNLNDTYRRAFEIRMIACARLRAQGTTENHTICMACGGFFFLLSLSTLNSKTLTLTDI